MKCIAKHIEKKTIEGISRDHVVTMDLASPLGNNKGMTPGEMLLNSVAGCKILSFTSVARLKGINFSAISVEITGEGEEVGFVEGTKIPRKEIKFLHTTYRLKTTNTVEEIEEAVKLVDQLCTVGNALSDKIEKTSEVIILD